MFLCDNCHFQLADLIYVFVVF